MVSNWGSVSKVGIFAFDNASILSIASHLIVVAIWSLRFCIDGHEFVRDVKYLVLLGATVVWLYREELGLYGLGLLWGLVLPIAVTALATVLRYVVQPRPNARPTNAQIPYLLPCRTAHTRIFPKKHSFSYSYLQVAIPVGWQGSVDSLVSVDQPHANTWFAVRGDDHLARGKEPGTLKAKLDDYLHSQAVDPSQYDAAWLVTAPRFLGYSFNPVSFWYLYKDGNLEAMVLEVNNTFDERRPYFLPRGHVELEGHSNANLAFSTVESTLSPTDPFISIPSTSTSNPKFSAHWPKDFHVSPFNSRKGAYRLSAQPPAFAEGVGIANTITLVSSKEHAKLVARLFSTSPPMPASQLTTTQSLLFILQWSWVGFVTYPRIVFQAARLFFQRQLHVWYRPEVTPTSIGRTETAREVVIERYFRKFVAHCVSEGCVGVKYTAAGNAMPRTVHFHPTDVPASGSGSGSGDELTLHILTPSFYASIATTPSIAVYMRHNAAQPVEQQTFTTSDLDALLLVLELAPSNTSNASSTNALSSAPSSTPQHRSNINALTAFVAQHVPVPEARRYGRVVRALGWADRYTGGYPGVLDLAVSCVRMVVVGWVVRNGVQLWLWGILGGERRV